LLDLGEMNNRIFREKFWTILQSIGEGKEFRDKYRHKEYLGQG